MDGSLLASVFVFLAAACLLVPISKISGLGSVIGYLIAGVLIGPAVAGLITEPETILHFSEFGVVMMLFLIGLELKPSHLWEMRARLVGLGGMQVGLSALAIAGGAFALGYGINESIVLGMALALSSTAIALQIMQDRGMMSTATGQSGFSVLLFQDVIVIAMIAVLPFLAIPGLEEAAGYVAEHGGSDHGASDHGGSDSHGSGPAGPEGIWRPIAILGSFAGMILAGRILLRPLFRLIARSQVRETFTAVALFLVVGAALLMNWLGLSAALGAFIAGVVLADSEYRHQLERDIEPFKALLLGLFFMSVGMSLDFGAIMASPVLILGCVIGLMTLKFAVLFLVGNVFKLELSSNLLFATLLCQAGEFGFVISQFALTEGAMRSETATVMNAVIALTMALTPLLILAYDKLIAPRFNPAPKTGDAPVDDNHRVLILGFGRVGQIAARLIHTQDIDTTIIDHDGDHIDFIKQFGYRVYYGDASDMDLLKTAGADHADVIIIAIDNRDKATSAARDIRLQFPQAKIIARAFGRPHMFELLAEEVDFVERETIRGALAMGEKALEFLGYDQTTADKLARDFLALDFKLVQDTYHMRDDIDALAERAAQSRELLKATLNGDQAQAADYVEKPGEPT